jgi:predicted molibdopterin-dependent oxidoreductase YjgC
MFRRRRETEAKPVKIYFEGQPVDAAADTTVAAALLCAGIDAVRSATVSGEERGPYCMIGVCFECLIEVDGVSGRQACMTQVRDGMRIYRQKSAVEAGI